MTGVRTICLTDQLTGQEVRCSKRAAPSTRQHRLPASTSPPSAITKSWCRWAPAACAWWRSRARAACRPRAPRRCARAWWSGSTPRQRRSRPARPIIEFLLTNHPLDCPVCDKGGECPLQDQALLDGPGQSRYVEEKRHKNKRYPLGELIVLDQERCVLCWRCIRFLDEWADDHELDLFGRGADTRARHLPRPAADQQVAGQHHRHLPRRRADQPRLSF